MLLDFVAGMILRRFHQRRASIETENPERKLKKRRTQNAG